MPSLRHWRLRAWMKPEQLSLLSQDSWGSHCLGVGTELGKSKVFG